MSDKRTTDWIFIETPDGKQLIAGPDYIRNLLGITENFSNLYRRVIALETQVERLRAPERKQAILESLSDGKRHTWWLIARSLPDTVSVRDLLEELVREGKVAKHVPKTGSRTYYLTESQP